MRLVSNAQLGVLVAVSVVVGIALCNVAGSGSGTCPPSTPSTPSQAVVADSAPKSSVRGYSPTSTADSMAKKIQLLVKQVVEDGGVNGIGIVQMEEHPPVFVLPGAQDDAFTLNAQYAHMRHFEVYMFRAILSHYRDAGITPRVILDCGGNNGVYTNFFANFAERVFSFEASPKTVKRLQLGVLLNGNQDVVDINHAAVIEDDEPSTVKYFVKGHSGMSMVVKNPDLPPEGIMTVRAMSLDYMLIKSGKLTVAPIFMKIDIEGSEIPAFRGATELLKRFPPRMIMSEVATGPPTNANGKMIEVFDILWAAGYRAYHIGRSDWLISFAPGEIEDFANFPKRELLKENREDVLKWVTGEIFEEVLFVHSTGQAAFESIDFAAEVRMDAAKAAAKAADA